LFSVRELTVGLGSCTYGVGSSIYDGQLFQRMTKN